MKQVFAGKALEAVLAAARRPPTSNEGSRTYRQVVTRRFEAKLRYQYIIVAVSGGNYSGEYIAFALPDAQLRQTSQGGHY